ncbi:MAG TPA: nucleotidyl transferase AbiEii/AbiGii toxin family protein [Polyangiaceae bacterium]|nr:nucleotidyl transferase AbiEii/AbiGii toxin family protein [Polyangiaceae bacterium]
MTKQRKDMGASVRARLLQLAKQRGDDFQLLLTRYANERLLYRLSKSQHGNAFLLKGAALFTLWTGHAHRATRDMDLLGFGEPSIQRLRDVFDEVIALELDDDGVVFDSTTLKVEPIREDQLYGDIRIVLVARITNAQVRLQVDVGFGDAVTPEAQLVEFPPLLDLPAPQLRAYPKETVVAEKLDAIVQLGLANTRMKDFYDLVALSNLFDFEGQLLVAAISATFTRRGTPLPTEPPAAFTPEFTGDATKNVQWTAFVKKAGVVGAADLKSTIELVELFVQRPLHAAAEKQPFAGRWSPPGPWT